MSNASANGQPCASVRVRRTTSALRAEIDAADPVSGLCSHRARSPGQCEACGLAEPDHAVSVNGRAAEPINSMGGAPSERVCAAAREASSRLEGCGTAMIENCTCSAFLDDSRRIPLPRKQEDGSTEGHAPIRKSRPDERAAIAGVSPYFRNHQFPFSYGDKRQNWLKPARLTPSLTSGRDTPRKFLASPVSGTQHLQTIARCPNGLSAALRRSDPPSATLPTP